MTFPRYSSHFKVHIWTLDHDFFCFSVSNVRKKQQIPKEFVFFLGNNCLKAFYQLP